MTKILKLDLEKLTTELEKLSNKRDDLFLKNHKLPKSESRKLARIQRKLTILSAFLLANPDIQSLYPYDPKKGYNFQYSFKYSVQEKNGKVKKSSYLLQFPEPYYKREKELSALEKTFPDDHDLTIKLNRLSPERDSLENSGVTGEMPLSDGHYKLKLDSKTVTALKTNSALPEKSEIDLEFIAKKRVIKTISRYEAESDADFINRVERIAEYHKRYVGNDLFKDTHFQVIYERDAQGNIIDAVLYFKFLKGITLTDVFEQGIIDKLLPETRLNLVEQLVNILAKMHKDGVSHNDFNPNNIMLNLNALAEIKYADNQESGEEMSDYEDSFFRSESSSDEGDESADDGSILRVLNAYKEQPAIVVIDWDWASTQEERRASKLRTAFTFHSCPPELLSDNSGELASPKSDIHYAAFILARLLFGDKAVMLVRDGSIRIPDRGFDKTHNPKIKQEAKKWGLEDDEAETDEERYYFCYREKLNLKYMEASTLYPKEIKDSLINMLKEMRKWHPNDRPSASELHKNVMNVKKLIKAVPAVNDEHTRHRRTMSF